MDRSRFNSLREVNCVRKIAQLFYETPWTCNTEFHFIASFTTLLIGQDPAKKILMFQAFLVWLCLLLDNSFERKEKKKIKLNRLSYTKDEATFLQLFTTLTRYFKKTNDLKTNFHLRERKLLIMQVFIVNEGSVEDLLYPMLPRGKLTTFHICHFGDFVDV